ncbi:MAG: inositol monophosphatase family protein [Bacteroidaceae bacterium]
MTDLRKTPEDWEKLLQEVCKTACEVGDFLRSERKSFQRTRVEEKGIHNYVSYVDKESEKRLIKILHDLLPEAGFIAEEGHGSYQNEPYCWLIDPLDGTTNYIHDQAPYCVSIALCDQKEMLLGVVYEVCRDELFYARKDGGAWLRSAGQTAHPIHVSDITDSEEAFIGMGLPYDSQNYSPMAQGLIRELYGQVAGIRILGSAAAELCYIAAGRSDGRIEFQLGPWDIAAGSLIIREAGGRITDTAGKDLFYNSKEVIASNGKIHDFLLKKITTCLKYEK